MSRKLDENAFERRVRPIYDALDARNFKNALKLANAALEKYPRNCMLMGLKAISLQRSSKEDEANKLCDDLVAARPWDEASLHPLMIVLKDTHRFSDIITLYENACERDPSNVDLLRSLFSSYVRISNSAKQQQVAMKLMKLQPNGYPMGGGSGSYVWWVVLSIVLQARSSFRGGSSAMDPMKLLQLAESMITRQAGKDGKLESFEALIVYVDVLMAQGKSQLALDCVSGALGEAASMPEERTHLRAVLSMMVGDLSGAASLLEGMLMDNADDWTSLMLYMDCMLPGSAVNMDAARSAVSKPNSLQPDSSLLRLSGGLFRELTVAVPAGDASTTFSLDAADGYKNVLALLEKLVALVEKPSEDPSVRKLTMRGAYIGKVELMRRAVVCKLSSEQDLACAVLAYYEQHGYLVSCATDLRVYTSQLSSEASAWLATKLQEHASTLGSSAAEGSNQEQVKTLRREVCAHQLLDDLGMPLFSTASSAVEHAVSLMQRYVAVQPLYKGLDDRERGPADELPVLAAGSMVTAASLATSNGAAVPHLLQALIMLLACVQTRPYSAAMRLSLTALYTILGCPAAANVQCRALEIKNIQMDSLASHHLLPPLLSYAQAGTGPVPATHDQEQLNRLLREMNALLSDHHRDAGETLFKAYKCGSYSKVLEFVAFRERLKYSHTSALAKAEASLLVLSHAAVSQHLEASALAVRSACLALPPADAPSSTAAPAREPSQQPERQYTSGCKLRFNEDLSTRPAWYPPTSEASHLAPTEWWSGRSSSTGQGYGRRWWSGAKSAESSRAEAIALREAKVGAVQRRWLLPHLLAGALMLPPDSNDPAMILPLGEALTRLSNSLSIKPETLLDDTQFEQLSAQLSSTQLDSASGSKASELVEARELDVLHLHLFAAAASVVSELESALGSSPSASEQSATCTATGQIAALQTLLASIAARVRGSTGSGGIVPGAVLNVAYVFVTEHVQLLVLCLMAWSKKVKAAKKKKGAPSTPSASLIESLASLHQSVATVHLSLTEAFTPLGGNPEAAGRKAEAALKLVEEAGAGSMSSLCSWQTTVVASKVVTSLVMEQQQTANEILQLVLTQSKAAAALSFA